MSAKFNFKTLETGFEADWPVTVSVPLDGGKAEEQTFQARFRSLSAVEQAEIDAQPDATGRLRAGLEKAFVRFGAGESEALTPELFETMWRAPNVQIGLIRAYNAFILGSPAKN